jgi:Family of unknown function (DUF5670)
MFMTLFVVLLVMWLLAFHVAGGLIHLLLIVAVISLVHFFRGSRAAWKEHFVWLLVLHPTVSRLFRRIQFSKGI